MRNYTTSSYTLKREILTFFQIKFQNRFLSRIKNLLQTWPRALLYLEAICWQTSLSNFMKIRKGLILLNAWQDI